MPKSLGAKEITVATAEQVVSVHRTDGTPCLFAGMRQEWMAGSDDETGAEFEMDAGAGVGTPYLTITVVLPNGKKVYEYVDMTELLTARVSAILAENA